MASIWPREDAYVWGPLLSAIVIFIANILAYALNPNSWAHRKILRKCGIPRMFFASNRTDTVDKRALPKTYWAFDLLEPAHVVQSYILSTPLLLVLHLFTFLYFVAVVIVDVVVNHYIQEGNRGPYGGWVTFLTNWSITLLGLAGLVAFIDTARQLKRERNADKCLKSAQPQVQRSVPSQRGNLDSCGDVTSWRDYQYASRTNSLGGGLRPTQPSPYGTVRTLNPNSPGYDTYPNPNTAVNPNGLKPNGLKPNGLNPNGVNPSAVAPKRQQASASAGAAPAGSDDDAHTADDRLAVGTPFHRNGRSDTIVEVHDGVSERKPAIKGIDEWDLLSGTHCILMEIGTTAAFFVSFWYWVGIVGIAQGGFALSAGTYMAHAGNVGVALLQILLTRQPIVSVHFQVLLWYATLYEVFLWIYGELSGIWRYNLDWQVSKPAGAFALIPAVTFVIFLLWYLAAVLRERAFVPVAEKVVRAAATSKRNGHKSDHNRDRNGRQPQSEVAMT